MRSQPTREGLGAARPVLSPAAVRRALPASPEALATVEAARRALAAGRPFVVIAGPGPARDARDPQELFEHARRLRGRVPDAGDGELLVLVQARVEALVDDPNRDGSRDPNLGIASARQLLLRINELGLPCALEARSDVAPYLDDLLAIDAGSQRGEAAGSVLEAPQEPAAPAPKRAIQRAARHAQPVSAGRR